MAPTKSEERLKEMRKKWSKMAGFGKELRSEFLLSDQYTFVNHGSYGAVAKTVNDAKARKQTEFESAPGIWFRRLYNKYYMENIESAATFLGATPDNIVFMSNTSTGINTVLRSLSYEKGDIILVTSWTYGSMLNAAQWISERTDAEVMQIEMKIPIKSTEDVIQSYRDIFAKYKIKLAIVDIISSAPAVKFPFMEIGALCKENGALVLLDGAHTPGHIPVELDKWGFDFYTGNIHKWAYSHRGCAVLYVKTEHLSYIDPLVTSINIHHADFRQRFYYQGTDDNTTFCVVKDAIQFYQDHGGLDAITTYTSSLATEAADMLMRRWDTAMMEIPADMMAPNMRMIRLPNIGKYSTSSKTYTQNLKEDLTELGNILLDRFNLLVFVRIIQGVPYIRISANIYNCMEDYEKLAEAILTLKQES